MNYKKSRSESASISLRKMIVVTLLFVFLLGASVLAGNTKLNSIKIRFANNHEIIVLTSSTKVKDIIEEKNIILSVNETTLPGLEEEIDEFKTIRIIDINDIENENIQLSSQEDRIVLEEVEKKYENIIEVIKTIKEEIPFETITKDASSGGSNTTNRIIQNGKNGLREVKYKIKYQADVEIEKVELSSKIIKEPINKIVQTQTISARSASRTAEETSSISGASGMYRITAYCSCAQCCGKTNGITASGTHATANHTVAAPSTMPFGTQLIINGATYVVEDRGGAIRGNRIDIYMNSHSEALSWGSRNVYVEVAN